MLLSLDIVFQVQSHVSNTKGSRIQMIVLEINYGLLIIMALQLMNLCWKRKAKSYILYAIYQYFLLSKFLSHTCILPFG